MTPAIAPSLGAQFQARWHTARSDRDAAVRAASQGFLDWVIAGNFYADREPVNFELWRVLHQVYQMFPTTVDGWRRFDFTAMKPSQAGLTILALLASSYIPAGGHGNVGYYLPTADLAWEISETRFIPLIRSNPALRRLMSVASDRTGATNRATEGSKSIRRLGDNYIFFTYLGGAVSTESKPLDVLVYDEVQEMALGDMQKADERLGATDLGAILRVSTANIDGSDIAWYYELSDQRAFHTDCGGCSDGVVLGDCWHPTDGPTCIAERPASNVPGSKSLPADEAFYVCPTCKTYLGTGGARYDKDTGRIVGDLRVQQGRFLAHAPDHAPRVGVSFPQMLSPKQTAARMLDAWRRRTDTGHFFRRKIGKPYTDPKSVPITEEILQAAQRETLRWVRPDAGRTVRREVDRVFLGIDHMKHDCHLVVKGRERGTSSMRLLWLEVTQGTNPFQRVHEVMRQFRVDVAVLEELPNVNEAWQFAEAFPGRVHLSTRYQELADELVIWDDRPRDRVTVRKTEREARLEWTCGIDQYRMMAWSLGRWVAGQVTTPPIVQLSQRMQTDEGIRDVAVGREFWTHLQRVALVTLPFEGREDERRLVRRVKKIRIDPHFAFANMLCDVAWIRRFGTEQMLIDEVDPAEEDATEVTMTAEQLRRATEAEAMREQLRAMLPAEAQIPLLDVNRAETRRTREAPLTCAGCQHYRRKPALPRRPQTGDCDARRFIVEPGQPACSIFDPVLEDTSYR